MFNTVIQKDMVKNKQKQSINNYLNECVLRGKKDEHRVQVNLLVEKYREKSKGSPGPCNICNPSLSSS